MPPTDDTARADLPLDADLAEIQREAQKVTDRETAARVELAAAIEARVSFRAAVSAKFTDVVAYIDDYVSPVVAAPPPIAPEVAAPPPAVEPPVFTTVDSAEVAPENSSGGVSEVAEDLVVVEAPPAGEGAGDAGGAAATE